MIPVMLDPSSIAIALIGRGERTLRRLAWLRELGADPAVYSDAPSPALAKAAWPALQARLPDAAQWSAIDIVWIADLDNKTSAATVAAARSHGVMTNVEDEPGLCHFHSPAVVRRGRLVLAAGTGGASPAAAAAVRRKLQADFPESWAGVIDALAKDRECARANGASMAIVKARAEAILSAHGISVQTADF
jgi:precorrin-2 dehydrogenase/sirohydrochlorin ferrochelatase